MRTCVTCISTFKPRSPGNYSTKAFNWNGVLWTTLVCSNIQRLFLKRCGYASLSNVLTVMKLIKTLELSCTWVNTGANNAHMLCPVHGQRHTNNAGASSMLRILYGAEICRSSQGGQVSGANLSQSSGLVSSKLCECTVQRVHSLTHEVRCKRWFKMGM